MVTGNRNLWQKSKSLLLGHTLQYSGLNPESMLRNIPGRLRGPYMVLGIQPRSTVGKIRTLYTLLSLFPQKKMFQRCFIFQYQCLHKARQKQEKKNTTDKFNKTKNLHVKRQIQLLLMIVSLLKMSFYKLPETHRDFFHKAKFKDEKTAADWMDRGRKWERYEVPEISLVLSFVLHSNPWIHAQG